MDDSVVRRMLKAARSNDKWQFKRHLSEIGRDNCLDVLRVVLGVLDSGIPYTFLDTSRDIIDSAIKSARSLDSGIDLVKLKKRVQGKI